MKFIRLKYVLSLCALLLTQLSNLSAGYPVYPPTSRVGVDGLIFADSDNEKMLRSCSGRSGVCARFYVLPKSISVKRNEETGARWFPMESFWGPIGCLPEASTT
jgi:hypothetical protein